MLPNKRMIEAIQARIADKAYSDTATIHYRTISDYDDLGQPTYTTSEVSVVCNFTDQPTKEVWTSYADIEEIAAEIRFDGAKPSKGDLVDLETQFGNTGHFTEQRFEIVGIRDRDAFGYVCALKAVQV